MGLSETVEVLYPLVSDQPRHEPNRRLVEDTAVYPSFPGADSVPDRLHPPCFTTHPTFLLGDRDHPGMIFWRGRSF